MQDYKLTEAGKYFFLRCVFNGRDLTPNPKPPRGAKIRKYDVWIKDQPENKKRLLIWPRWGAIKTDFMEISPGRINPLDVKDKACIDELFKFNDYQKLKIKRVR